MGEANDDIATANDHLAFAERLISAFEPSAASRDRLERQVQRARQRLTDERYYLAVVGEFSAGKSTFINAVLEAELFASHALATTAVAVRVSHGERLTVRVTFTDGTTWDATDKSAKRAWRRLGRDRSAKGSPQDIAQLRKRLRKMDLLEALELITTDQAVAETATSVEVTYPSPFLANGVVLIDTPGMDAGTNAGPRHAEITHREVTSADATVVVMKEDQVLTQTLARFLVNEIDEGVLARCAFVVTAADQVDQAELDDLYQTNSKRISRMLGISDPPVAWAAPLKVVQALRGEALSSGSDAWIEHFARTRDWLFRLTAARRPAAVADSALRIIDELLAELDGELRNAIAALDKQRAELNTAAPADMGTFLSGHVTQGHQALESAEREATAMVSSAASYAIRRAESSIEELLSAASRSQIKEIVTERLEPLLRSRQEGVVSAARSATKEKLGGAFTRQSSELATAFKAEYGRLQRINAAPMAALSAGSLAGAAGVQTGSFDAVVTLADHELTQKGIAVGGGAAIGAVVGTFIFPGVGTAIGALFGGLFGSLFGPPIAQVRAEAIEKACDAVRQAIYQAERQLTDAIARERQNAQTALTRQAAWYRTTYEKAVLAMREQQEARRVALLERKKQLTRARAQADQRRASIAADRGRLRVVQPVSASDL